MLQRFYLQIFFQWLPQQRHISLYVYLKEEVLSLREDRIKGLTTFSINNECKSITKLIGKNSVISVVLVQIVPGDSRQLCLTDELSEVLLPQVLSVNGLGAPPTSLSLSECSSNPNSQAGEFFQRFVL